MPKFKIRVTELVKATYCTVEVEADDEDAAKDKVEAMRGESELRINFETVCEVEMETLNADA